MSHKFTNPSFIQYFKTKKKKEKTPRHRKASSRTRTLVLERNLNWHLVREENIVRCFTHLRNRIESSRVS